MATEPLSLETAFDLCRDFRRRTAISVLAAHEVPLALADLADEVVVRERGARITDVPAEAVTDVYLSLYHVHVPKLVDADVAEYDQERDIVRVTDLHTQLVPYLPDASGPPDPHPLDGGG